MQTGRAGAGASEGRPRHSQPCPRCRFTQSGHARQDRCVET
jgi:hypothetical protein